MNKPILMIVAAVLGCSSCRTATPSTVRVGELDYPVVGQVVNINPQWGFVVIETLKDDARLSTGVELLPVRQGLVIWGSRLRLTQHRGTKWVAEIVVNRSDYTIKAGDFACLLPRQAQNHAPNPASHGTGSARP